MGKRVVVSKSKDRILFGPFRLNLPAHQAAHRICQNLRLHRATLWEVASAALLTFEQLKPAEQAAALTRARELTTCGQKQGAST